MRSTKTTTAGAAVLLLLATQAHGQATPTGNVTFSGIMDAGLYARRLAGEPRAKDVQGGMLSMSRLDIRGVEPLGGDMAAMFELSTHMRLDTGEAGRHPGDTAANRFYSRAAWVGLRGAWGQLRLGRIPTGSFVQTLRFTPFGDSTFLGPFMMHTYVGSQPMLASHSSSDGSWSNSIAYNSPTLAGLSTHLQLGAPEGGTAGRRLDATLAYTAGALSASLSHGRVENAALTAPRTRTDPAGAPYVVEEERSTLANLAYTFGPARLSAQAAVASLRPRGGARIDLDTWGLNADVALGPGRVIAGWARTQREQPGVSERRRQTLSAGYRYGFSKRTDGYAVAIHDRATSLTSGTGLALGLRHTF